MWSRGYCYLWVEFVVVVFRFCIVDLERIVIEGVSEVGVLGLESSKGICLIGFFRVLFVL